jgi:hypothetical protein
MKAIYAHDPHETHVVGRAEALADGWRKADRITSHRTFVYEVCAVLITGEMSSRALTLQGR